MKTHRWKPVAGRDTLCAPGCGRGCTKKEHDRAVREGARLALSLGSGWSPEIWENLGWHWAAISPCGRIKVHPSSATGFHAFLGEPGCAGGRWAVYGKTARSSVRNVVRAARAELSKIGAMIEGLPC